MEAVKMMNVTVNGKVLQYPYGTAYRTIAADFQAEYPHAILLLNRDGKLRELHKTLKRDCTLSMVTAADKPGHQTYERSAILLMLKAFYDVVGRENIRNVSVQFSLSSALFCRADGAFTLDAALLSRVEARMRELATQALPIEKQLRGCGGRHGPFPGQRHGGQGAGSEVPHQLPGKPVYAGRLHRLFLWLYGAGHRLSPVVCAGAL